MLIAEYSYETDIKVQCREAYREGLAEGIEQGISQGIEQGIEQGAEQTKIETTKKLFSMGLSLEQVAEGTGLPLEKVKELNHFICNLEN